MPSIDTAPGPIPPSSPATPARDLSPGGAAEKAVSAAVAELRGTSYDVPSIVGGKELRSGDTLKITVPHDHGSSLGIIHQANIKDVEAAIEIATDTAPAWGQMPWKDRVAIFERAADLMENSRWRDRLVAAAMLELSKTAAQAEGDAICEAVDFIRANIANAAEMDAVQPFSPPGVRNSLEYRPLEGFVFAITPFNFVAMSNLALGPALLGNTVLWKPAETAALSGHLILSALREAGLPDGVINMVHGDGPSIGAVALGHPDLAAVHFTGSTATFQDLWRGVAQNLTRYRNYPRIVGETGGKDFVVAHRSADVDALAVACVTGAFDYQGQKCAAASRLYAPRSLWPSIRDRIVDLTESFVPGDPTDPGVRMGAVISERQFNKHVGALTIASQAGAVVVGGGSSGSTGWFVEPTLLEVHDPQSPFLTDELFAPVLAAFVYDDNEWEETLRLVDESTVYGLTGSVFAQDESALATADSALRYTAGNYYVNDRPTGAIVGQQPFGGSRASGTNDKAGTIWNLIRFVSPRSIKHNMTPPRTLD